jgi:hypothetical protein
MFQLSFRMMEFCPVEIPVADKWIIGFILNSSIIRCAHEIDRFAL